MRSVFLDRWWQIYEVHDQLNERGQCLGMFLWQYRRVVELNLSSFFHSLSALSILSCNSSPTIFWKYEQLSLGSCLRMPSAPLQWNRSTLRNASRLGTCCHGVAGMVAKAGGVQKVRGYFQVCLESYFLIVLRMQLDFCSLPTEEHMMLIAEANKSSIHTACRVAEYRTSRIALLRYFIIHGKMEWGGCFHDGKCLQCAEPRVRMHYQNNNKKATQLVLGR